MKTASPPRPRNDPSQLVPPDSQSLFHRLRKLRMYFAWPFVVALAIFSRTTDLGFWVGAPVILTGEAVRIWSHGYLRKSRQLATDGPYAYVRNPLYLGNFLIGSGFCFVIWQPLIFSIFAIGFFLVYWVTVKGEEEKLAFKFKEDYSDYVRNVPRFIPRLIPYRNRENSKFKFHRVWGHGEHITLLTMISLFLLLYLRQELYQKHNPLTVTTVGVFVLTVCAGMAVTFAMLLRYGPKSKNPA